MVAPSFPWFRQAGRNDPNPRAALCVDDGKEVVLDHAEQDIATLAVILTPVLTYHSERVIEGQASCLKAYAVIGQILGGLDVIPLELSSSRSEPQGYFGLFLSFLILSAPRSAKAVGDIAASPRIWRVA